MAHNNITHIDIYVLERMQKNPRRSLSALFRQLRMKVPLIGDYIVLRHIINICYDNGYKFSKNQLLNACQSSREFKESPKSEKSQWLKDLNLNRL